ncbi:MAG: anti-sigma factor antagonist [Xanthomonadales bacterium]|jgi:anti-sigma B factor antagonist|nr:MAG: STAS domain-containing protein [Dokdonella sp.]MBC6942269.1 anti-sigma factor antagonist [Xanthomonadales bacterium]MCC6596690.1 STAS domain-containing protein [Rhodanobacteraceae bacterium]MDL1867887.1 STAS domain-containing protein [Gammaproteobacteria bacterium PRO6]
MSANANAVTRQRVDGATIVCLQGEVDLSWSQQVRRAVLDAFADGVPVGVDLAGVGYIDSSGIAALVEGLQLGRARGQRFALVAPSDAVRAVLELARLDRVFTIVDSAAAVGAAT